MAGGTHYFWLGASADADRVLSASPTEPVVSAHSGNARLREEIRLECLKLAHDWGKLRYRQGYSGISLDDVTEKGAELFAFCIGVPE